MIPVIPCTDQNNSSSELIIIEPLTVNSKPKRANNYQSYNNEPGYRDKVLDYYLLHGPVNTYLKYNVRHVTLLDWEEKRKEGIIPYYNNYNFDEISNSI